MEITEIDLYIIVQLEEFALLNLIFTLPLKHRYYYLLSYFRMRKTNERLSKRERAIVRERRNQTQLRLIQSHILESNNEESTKDIFSPIAT